MVNLGKPVADLGQQRVGDRRHLASPLPQQWRQLARLARPLAKIRWTGLAWLMTIYNLGSINIDHVYQVPAFPKPGETLVAQDYAHGLGGKGANQSVAAALAGAQVSHIGAIGPDAAWAAERLQKAGVSTKHVAEVAAATGHAIIFVDRNAENLIVLHNGANYQITSAQVQTALAKAAADNWLLLQNETNFGVEAAKLAKYKGLKIAYSAAPFETDAVREILPLCDLLVLNEVEVAQARAAIPGFDATMATRHMVVTKGSAGAEVSAVGRVSHIPSFTVEPVDTTGAGDTFLGYLLASIAQGEAIEPAAKFANAAAALQVTKPGAIEAIPSRAEVEEFLERHAR